MVKDQNKNPLSTKKLSFSYKEKKVLDNMNLNISKKNIVSIVGRSGEGKSTFLKLVVGALSGKEKGTISILGFSKNLAKKDIGFVPQELSFIPHLSIKENIIFFSSINGIKQDKALKKAKELMKALQLNITMDRHPSTLSGGQKVRLNIILSILHEPEVIILDEPFAGLDYMNRKMLWHFLQQQKRKRRSIIMTTHLLSEAENHANTIVLLRNGKVYAKGNMDQIRKKLDIYHIVEVKIKNLSNKVLESLTKYSESHDITIIDYYRDYFMFSVKSTGQRNYLLRYLEKINAQYEEISFREPNLDEMFLKVATS